MTSLDFDADNTNQLRDLFWLALVRLPCALTLCTLTLCARPCAETLCGKACAGLVRMSPAHGRKAQGFNYEPPPYKNRVGQTADGDDVGNWWIMCQTYSGDGRGRLESVPGL